MEAIEMIKYEKPHEETKQNKHETSPMVILLFNHQNHIVA